MTNKRIGIAVVTYNRRDVLFETIEAVRRMTGYSNVDFVVADDGSTDGTLDALRHEGVPVVTGANMGIAWNKNRALFLLGQLLACETVILLEDDARPIRKNWEKAWIEATHAWGHINWAKPDIRDRSVSGAGTPEEPLMCPVTSAQCAAFSRSALTYAGYMDTRFRGYGHEHVEHSRRMIRAGYGGTDNVVNGAESVLFSLIDSDVAMVETKSYFDEEQVQFNHQVAVEALTDKTYRAPWRDESEMIQFRAEMAGAMRVASAGFDLFGQRTLASGLNNG